MGGSIGKEWAFIPGDYWAECDRCGFKLRRSQLKQTWDNLLVCEKDFEVRHPQDKVRSLRDIIRVPDARPRPTIAVTGRLPKATVQSGTTAERDAINATEGLYWTNTDTNTTQLFLQGTWIDT